MRFLDKNNELSIRRQVFSCFALIVIAFVGNYLHASLFTGVDFLFGSIVVFIILSLYGISWAVLASIIASSYTLILWHHSYAFFTFALETLVVGLAFKRKGANIPLSDGIFWVALGMPMAWVLHFGLLHFDASAALLIALKQGVNGYFNALVASLILTYLPIQKWLGAASDKKVFSLQQALTSLLVVAVIFPAMAILVINNREEDRQMHADVSRRLSAFSDAVASQLSALHQGYIFGLNGIADRAARMEGGALGSMQHDLDVVQATFPGLNSVHVGDASGAVASYAVSDDKITRHEKLNFSDRPWFKELQVSRKPVVSEVFIGKLTHLPVVSISVPILGKGNEDKPFTGFVVASLKLGYVSDALSRQAHQSGERAMVVDFKGQVVATTFPDVQPGQRYTEHRNGVSTSFDPDVYQWNSGAKGPPTLIWRNSFYGKEIPLAKEIPWRLITEVPAAPYYAAAQRANIKAFALIILLATLAYLFGRIISRILAKPLTVLSQATTGLNRGEREAGIGLLESPIKEIHDLVRNFGEMEIALGKTLQALNQANKETNEINVNLEQRVEARTQQLALLNEQLQQAAKALHMKEREQATLLDNLPDLVWSKDGHSRYVFVNRAFESATGLSSSELRGKTEEEISPSDEALACKSDDKYARDHHETLVKEKVLTLKNTGRRTYETTRSPVYDSAGECVGTIGVFHDITERRQYEEQLAKAMNELAQQKFSLDQHSIVSITDVSGVITYANDKFLEISGYSRAELLGSNHRIVNSGYHAKEFWSRMWADISQGKVWHGVIKNRSKSGDDYWVDSTIVPFLDENGLPYQYISIRTDFTAHKQTEEALTQAKIEADRANRAKSEFLANMSHELRTPMNAILGFGQLMESDPEQALTASQQENVDYILKGGRHLLGLINEVLDLAKIEAGKIELLIEAVDLGEAIQESTDLLAPLMRKKNMSFVDGASAYRGRFVRADRTRLKQALLNLLSNAIKYTPNQGVVTLSCSAEKGDRIRVSIADTGQGIPIEKQGLLFQPFNRLGAEDTTVEGTGVGLAITKQIIEMMEGTVGVSSTLGQGSTFWIELDAAPAPVPDEAGSTPTTIDPRALPKAGRNLTILYVEDNADNIALVEQVLARQPGIKLLTAHSAELGLDLARAHRPDLVLLDINLPDMDGFAVIEQLRLIPETKTTPVIALSANAMPSAIQKGRKAGFADYLIKPIDISALVQAIESNV